MTIPRPRDSVAAVEAVERALTLRLTERLAAASGKCPVCWQPRTLTPAGKVTKHIQPSLHTGPVTCPGSTRRPLPVSFDLGVGAA